MDLNPSPEQQQLVDTFSALYAKEATPARVRAAEHAGHDPELWERLVATGVLAMAVGEGSGGWGATLLDLALVAEQHGRHLGPAPLLEAQVAARLLERAGTAPATALLERVLAGDELVTVALHGSDRGVLRLVPAGAVASRVLAVVDGRLLSVDAAGGAPVTNIGSLPLADVPVAGAHELAGGDAAVAAHQVALDEWAALMANAVTGLAARALEMGVAYAKERHAFGVPIGSFQAVAHGLADAATAVDGSTLLAREAAWAAGEEPGRARELAALAFGFATETARQSALRSLHY
ncbi:MAG: acyl-CoA dehydrogenase family protein, partial [Acidimicrobiales bacterium]